VVVWSFSSIEKTLTNRKRKKGEKGKMEIGKKGKGDKPKREKGEQGIK
jgi:hypothetical protein